MIFADTSVWIDHLRAEDPNIGRLVERLELAMHPFVLGELVLGSIANRADTIAFWLDLPTANVVPADDILSLVERRRLFSRGVGYTDVNLLASALLGDDLRLWTRDRRLGALAADLGVLARIDH